MTQQTAAWQKRAFVAKQVLGADTMLVKPAGWGRYKSTENHVKEKWLAFSSRNKIGSIAKEKERKSKEKNEPYNYHEMDTVSARKIWPKIFFKFRMNKKWIQVSDLSVRSISSSLVPSRWCPFSLIHFPENKNDWNILAVDITKLAMC